MIKDGNFYGLAVDWITGNLYGATRGGYTFVCNTSAVVEPLNCPTSLSSLDGLSRIALSPNDEYAYTQLSKLKRNKSEIEG